MSNIDSESLGIDCCRSSKHGNIKRHSRYLEPMFGDLVKCTGNTKEQTIAKCEIAAFIGAILPALVAKVNEGKMPDIVEIQPLKIKPK